MPRGTLVPFRVTTRLRLQLRYPCRHARAGKLCVTASRQFCQTDQGTSAGEEAARDLPKVLLPADVSPQRASCQAIRNWPASPIVVLRFVPHCRVASRNFVTGGLTKDVTRHFVDQSLDGLAPPHPHTLLKRIELAQTVPARVSR